MKSRFQLSDLFIILSTAAVIGLTACSTTNPSPAPSPSPVTSVIEASLPLIRTGAAVATGAVLDFEVQQTSTRTRLANEMYAAASAVYALTGTGTIPTPDQFTASVNSFGGSADLSADYAKFSGALGAIYAAWYPKLNTGDVKTATDLLNAIAGGIEDATGSYVAVTAPPAP